MTKVFRKHKSIFVIVTMLIVILLSWSFINSFSETTTSTAWDGVVANSFKRGTGTVKNPYIISDASEFAYFKTLLEGESSSSYTNKNYKIINGINYGDYDISINNKVAFSGVLDGNGVTINHATMTKSLFNSLNGATIKNIAFKDIDYTLDANVNGGLLATNSVNSIFDLILLHSNINLDSTSKFGGVTYQSSGSTYSKIITNYTISSITNNVYPVINMTSNDTISNVLVKTDNYTSNNSGISHYTISNNNIVLDTGVNLEDFSNDTFEINNTSGRFTLDEKAPSTPSSTPNTVHASGIDGTAVHINDLTADYNYYTGRNYTEITNTNGTIPSGSNQNLYSDSNLATLYIRYSSADINDSTIYGAVSPNENYTDFYYYKRYPVVNGYVTFDLIDNPWAKRPRGRAFNGWVTDYSGAEISININNYIRTVKIPVSNVNDPISITFYSSWTNANIVTSYSSISSAFDEIGMTELAPQYEDLTVYYVRRTVNRNSYYPSSNYLYDLNGNHIASGSRCRTNGGCTYIMPNTNNNYDPNTTYYSVTPNGNNAATVTVATPQMIAGSLRYYTNGGTAAGYFVKVTSGTENIYSSSGQKLTSCSGTCYKMLQYGDTIDDNTIYYYLTTRDTNIFIPSYTYEINTSDIDVTRPMTITGISDDGVDNSNNRTILLDYDWYIDDDLRIEFVKLYVNSTNTTVSEFQNNSYKIIGNANNLKIGRGLKRNDTYLTATSFVGTVNDDISTFKEYSTIVESGFYQNGSGTGYGGSASTQIVSGTIILGSDFDRVSNNGKNDNSKLIVYYAYSGSWASTLYNSSSLSNTYDKPVLTTIVKSGSFGTNEEDYAAGIYVGGRGRGSHYAMREILVEGGYIYNLIGGPASDDGRASKNDIIINVKDGTINMIFGGAGVSNTVGNRILNITGGTINYSILGGSNAYSIGSNSSDPYGKIDGDTLLYIGGNVTVGNTTGEELYNIGIGNVFGAGNGRRGELDVGSVNNSNVIIGPEANIKGNVFGGGNFGAVGGNTTGNSSSPTAVTESGVYEDGTTDNNIRYYGSAPSNYIQFNNELYRIVGLFNNVSTTSGNKNLVRIVKNTASSTDEAWLDEYISSGSNRYYSNYFVRNNGSNTKSAIYDYLNTTYYNGINNTYRNYIQSVNWSLGAVENANNRASNFYTAERGNTAGSNYSTTSFNYNIGLMYPSDFGFANNEDTCLALNLGSYSNNSTCYNNNWIDGMITSDAWTMTPSTAYSDIYNGWYNYSYYAYNEFYLGTNHNIVSGGVAYRSGGIFSTSYNYRSYAVYPSFYLKDTVTISGGTGTASDPYIIGSGDTLIDIIDELMHPTTVEPTEPVIIHHEESDYQARTHINVIGGEIQGSIYGAGNRNGAGTTSGNNVALAKIDIDMNGGEVGGSIYGGSNEEGKVYGDVFLDIVNGEVDGSIYGGGQGGHSSTEEGTYVLGNVEVNIGSQDTTDLTIHTNVYGGSAFGTVNAVDENTELSSFATTVTVNDGVIEGSVFGGGQGNTTYTPKVVGPIDVIINGGDITNVFGGNDQAGTHDKLNRVYLNGGDINSVYGGGNKSSVTNTHVYENGATVGSIYGGSNTLGDVTTSNVNITSGTAINVFGGNNEGGTCTTTNVLVQGTATVSTGVYGGGNQVDSTTTNVNLVSGTVNSVYGGGNKANVTTSNITQNGVNATNIFGGSNSSGTVTTSNITHTSGTTTNVYGGNNAGGNTITSNITFNGGTATSVYGGGNQANGETSNVEVNGGTITNLYGGGNSAGLTESSNVTVNSGNVTYVYGGSNTTGTVPTTNVEINSTSSEINSVYGGGNRAEAGNTNITINSGRISNVYGGGNLAQVTGNTRLDIDGGTISHNVYGGGNFGVVKGSSNVTITDATILGSAYAGGNGGSATLQGNTSITIDGSTVIGTASSVPPTTGSVFGGGNKAATGISNSTSTVNIAGGTIYGNVYGGANTSVINGNTTVNIGNSVPNISTLEKENIFIKGHVFGGGEANESGSEIYDWDFISVTQGTQINIDAATYTDFDINGSFFGGGNASSASGDSYLSIKNYGTVGNPEENISIQRVKYVTIENSSILLDGAVDRANEYSNELFAISRVVQLNIKDNSEMYFKTGANLLENFYSLDAAGNYAVVTLDTDNNTITNRTTNNRIYMYEGKNLNIAKDQQVTDYGDVKGMTFLGIFNFDGNGHVNTGIYNSTYAPGDTLDWAGTFSKGSYVLGAHKTNHDIKVDGFYSNFMNEETEINEINYINPTPASGKFYMWYIGENVIEYNVNLVASKYSTLGSVEASFLEFNKPNTSFQILSFDSSEIASGISLVDKNDIPRIASNVNDANTKFGLTMEASNNGWLTTGKTSFYTREPSMSGVTYYEGENSNVVPTMLFYLHHSKNLSLTQDLGVVRISVMAITKLNALSNEVKRLVINVNMSTALFQTTEYEGAMTPGDKYELFTSTANNITTKSKFSAYYALYGANENIYKPGYHRVLSSSYVLPVGTKITMLDFVQGEPEYYYHVITSQDVATAQAEFQLEGECSYPLSIFTRMGSKSNNSNYDDAAKNAVYYDGTDSSEEFIFIVDFSDTTITSNQLNNTLLIEIRDSNEESIITVLGIQHSQLTYNLYYGLDSQIDLNVTPSDNPLYIGYNDIFDVVVNYSNSSLSDLTITDTQYFDSKLGVQIYLKNSDGHVVSGTDLTGTYFLMDGTIYYPDIAGYTHIKLSDKIGNTRKWITFNTENSSLATGSYTFVVEAFASYDGIYYSKDDPEYSNIPLTIINSTYGLNPVLDNNSVVFSATNDKNLKFTVSYTSHLDNPNIRLAMYRRNYDEVYDTDYTLVDLQDFANQHLYPTSNTSEYLLISNPNANNEFTILLKNELLTGTYRLCFRLYDDNTQIGEIIRYIIIK